MLKKPWQLVAYLTTLNLLNYLDRMVLAAVLPKLEHELGLTGLQAGLLATVFLVGYFVSAPVFSKLARTVPRKHLVALGAALWSLATIASGLSDGFASLMLARAFVGIGEASFVTLAPTLIDDVTPTERKGKTLATFFLAVPLGAAAGYLLGGWAAETWSWRHAFWIAGVPGLVLAGLGLAFQEPKTASPTIQPSLWTSARTLFALPYFRRAVLGFTAYTAGVGAFSYWGPHFIHHNYGLALDKANFWFGSITVGAGALGTYFGGRLADKHHLVGEPRLRRLLAICAVSTSAAAGLAVVNFLVPGATAFFIVVFFVELAIFMPTSPINAVLLASVPESERATGTALCVFVIHIAGDLWSPPAVGWLADVLPRTLAMMSLPVMLLVGGLWWWPRKPNPTSHLSA